LTRDHHAHAFSQQGPLLRGGQHTIKLGGTPSEPAAQIGTLKKVDFLFRKVQRRLHQHAQFDQPTAQAIDLVRELAGQ